MTVPLELSGRGPERPALLTDLLVTTTTLPGLAERWGARVGPETTASGAGTGARADAPTTIRPGAATPGSVGATLESGVCAYLDLPGWVGGAGAGSSSEPVEPPADEVVGLADVVITAVHSGVGFGVGLVPRCGSVEQVWAVLGAAVAAMTGADVRAALLRTEPERVRGLGYSAGEAVRDVITFCLVDEARIEEVGSALGG